jgi:hypothetical protein
MFVWRQFCLKKEVKAMPGGKVPDFSQGIRGEMHRRVREKGLTLEDWGRAHGIPTGGTAAAVSRYVGKDQRPTSWRAKEIIEGLEELTGLKLCG